jgi:hypothetical protein
MTKHDKKWNRHCEQLVEFKGEKGNCLVPQKNKDDNSLGIWVRTQRTTYNNNSVRPDRKRILDEIGFVWTVESAANTNDKLWHQQHEKLVMFKREKGHRMVPCKHEQDKPFGAWVNTQRVCHEKDIFWLD